VADTTIRIACPAVCSADCALRSDGCESRRWADVRLNHAPPMPVSPCCRAAWVSHGIALGCSI